MLGSDERYAMAGINLPWLSEHAAVDYQEYRRHFSRFRAIGINTVRVWAAPWEVPYGTTESAYIANRVLHFRRLMEIAAGEDLRLVVCLHSHVELLGRSIKREVRNPDWGWRGNPLSFQHSGSLRRASHFFHRTDVTARIIDGLLEDGADRRALAAFDLFNEPDRVPRYSRAKVSRWANQLKGYVSAVAPSALVCISAANPFEAFELAKRCDLGFASIHFHGWPLVAAHKAIDVIVMEAVRRNQNVVFTEISENSQDPPKRTELARWASLAAYAGRMSGGRYAFLWWWPEVSTVREIDETISRSLAGDSSHFEPSMQLSSPALVRPLYLDKLRRNLLHVGAWRRSLQQLVAAWRHGRSGS